MRQSDSIVKIAAALLAAQAEIPVIRKDSKNPHFKNNYASLDTILEHVMPVLSRHGLAVVQGMATPADAAAGRIVVETMLLHDSGEFLVNAAMMPIAKQDPQGAGAALTYGRRYGLSALLSIATEEDDDGNAGSRSGSQSQRRDSRPAARSEAPARAAATASDDRDVPTEKQVEFMKKLMKSHTITDADRAKINRRKLTRDSAKKAIDWLQTTIKEREAAEQEDDDQGDDSE